MELQGERLIPVTVETTWEALNDTETLKGCIANCESLERTGDNTLAAVVVMKVGPVSARFKGNLTMTNVQAPNSYTIQFEGQGGVAGFGKGSADVSLLPAAEGKTTLTYLARATVGGKIAQIGSRLIDSAAAKITNDFFTAFETQLEARSAALASGSSTEVGAAAGTGGSGDGAVSGTPGTPGQPNFRVADPPPPSAGRALVTSVQGGFAATATATGDRDPSVVRLWGLIGAVIALAAVYFSIR